ncbi:MAG: FHA domain-containing protein [Lachnospiraceae bacterium]|nr:FHA domain-containing protein [Lachnospiraceae bacterium]
MRAIHHVWQKLALFAAAVCLLFASFTVYAADASAVSTLVSGGNIYVYVSGISDIQSGSTVQIGNVPCDTENISAGTVANLNVSMRTIILLDNSKSIPSGNHADIQEILNGLVANALENEQIRIGTFSDDVVYLCDFTSNKEELAAVVEGITYNDQETYLSDVLYDVISGLDSSDGVYTRLLVISDGADNKTIGYTNEELRSLIEDNPYQAYTIGTQGSNNSSELETMFSFSRASSADYFLLDGETSNEEIITALLEDQNNFCVRIVPDESLKDGSNKKILLSLVTSEGTVEIVTSADMPFGTGTASTVVETKEEPEEEEKEEDTGTDLPSLEPSGTGEAKEEKKDGISPILIAVIVIVLVIVLAAVVLLVVLKKKKPDFVESDKKEEEDKKKSEEKKAEKEEEPEDNTEDDTVFGGNDRPDSGTRKGNTKFLWGEPKEMYLRLSNLDKNGIIYETSIKARASRDGSAPGHVIHIGRKDADIVIKDDNWVSKSHCDITVRGKLLYLKDNDSLNGTFYGNERVHEEIPIISGGTIKIGRYHYRVDLID